MKKILLTVIITIMCLLSVEVVFYKIYHKFECNRTIDCFAQENNEKNKNNYANADKLYDESAELEDNETEMLIPLHYFSEFQIVASEYNYTLRYNLFQLYKFLKLNPNEQISKFENENDGVDMFSYPEFLYFYMRQNQQYKITDNYCIAVIDGSSIAQKVLCTEKTKSISDLPDSKCPSLLYQKHLYGKINIENLWKEFDEKGIVQIEKEIETEREEWDKLIDEK